MSEMRWPRIDLNLAASPELVDDWLACTVQSRATAANPPDEVAGDDIDVIIEGYSEVLGFKDWLVSLNCSPAQPWTVGVLDSATLGKLDTAGSQLAASATTTTTSLSVSTTAGPLWTTDVAEFPFDIRCGGERMTVTAISGASSPQTFTVIRSVNGVVKAHSSGTALSLWQPLVLAL